MQLRPEDISIAVTVYRRLDYLESALESAVQQTVPVRVRLYDDGCQDQPRLQALLARFGGKVEHVQNPRTLGLFGNMNAALQQSPTPWVSVLHDDDRLAPDFVERILEVAPEVEQAALFCGGTLYLSPEGEPFHTSTLPKGTRWKQISAEEFALRTWFAFPGQLIHAPTAVQRGCFPTRSLYTGDWELWFQLTLAGGAVQVEAVTGWHRTHLGADRGTTAAAKTGRRVALSAMQAKRNLGRLRKAGRPVRFDRSSWVRLINPLYRDLIVYTATMPRWLLSYNRKLFLHTRPESASMRWLQRASRWFGNPALRAAGHARALAIRFGMKPPRTF
jgi:glycosyltransferase involved in cell wall biosynthesis